MHPCCVDRWHGIRLVVAVLSLLPGLTAAKPLEPKRQSDDWSIPDEREEFHVFLLMGQSNMAGAAAVTNEDRIPVPGILSLTSQTPDQYAWKPAKHPLHDRETNERFGPGLAFAEE